MEVRDRALLLVPDIAASFAAAEFAERGAWLDEAGRAWDGKLALIELANGDAAPVYFAGTGNFYAITRYNWSSYYAMAVIELGGHPAILGPVNNDAGVAQGPMQTPHPMPQGDEQAR